MPFQAERKCGKAARVQELRKLWDQGQEPTPLPRDQHNIAALLTAFLREVRLWLIVVTNTTAARRRLCCASGWFCC